MIKLQYIGEKSIYDILFKKLNSHVVQITGSLPIKEKGFICYREECKEDVWDYANFTTIYKEIEGGVQFSNDGSVYVAPSGPEPQPDPEPYVPTLDEVKDSKKQEIRSSYQIAKLTGMDVELSTGTEHFPLTDEDITFLMGKQFELASGSSETISYQDSESHCKFYSRADMQAIIQNALLFVNYQTTYRNNLCEWVEKCGSAEEVESISYGIKIPEEHQNDVYRSYLARMGGTE